MNREQQIEEMAKVIDDRLIEARGWLGSMNRGKGYWIAQKLVENYQPKLPEDSIVLSREELSKEPYNDFCKGCPNVRVRSSGMTDCCADYSCEQFQKYASLIELYKQSRNETEE